MTGEKLLTAEEVAELLQVPASWAARAARDGEIPCVRLGRYVRFDPAVVRKYISNRRRPRA